MVKAERPSPATLGQKALLRRYIPPSVIINSRHEVLHAFSRLAPFLEPPVGEATRNILKMAGKELRPVLRAAIHQAFSEGKPCSYERVWIEIDGVPRFINILVEPIREPPAAQDMAMVCFEPVSDPAANREDLPSSENELVHHLEDQLRVTTEQLHANLEESERGEEELKSSNEELMSMNEELQSAYEELETSKEELQALNEELVTVNSELQSKLEELSQANNDMQNLMHSSQVATIFLDKKLRIKRYTSQVAEIFNLIEGDIGRPIRHISSNIDYPELEEDAKRVVRDLQPVEREVRGPRQGDYLLRVLPYRTMEDVIEGVVLTFLDISERKERERSLTESEERFRLLADNISQFAWIADEEVRIQWFNKRWYDYTGTSFAEMKDWGWREVHHPDHIERVLEKVQRSFEQGEPWEDTFPLRGKDKQYRWYLSRAFPIRDENGAVTRWFGTNTDITELRKAEKALAEARDRAEAANRTKSQFLANISHEIRTPIAVTQGALDYLLDAGLEEEYRRVVDMARSASATLLRLIEDILDFAKIEAGTLRVVDEPFELRSWIEKAVEALSLQFEEKGLKVRVEVPAEVPGIVLSDPHRFHQILYNLLGNAIKFTEEGEISVQVKLQDETASGRNFLEVSVSDTGIGIPENKQEDLFETFTQADSSHSRYYGGAGLGLAICKGLVELMGGEIALESREEEGSTFRFRLPMNARDQGRKGNEENSTLSGGVGTDGAVRILLAEDDPLVAQMLTIMLRKLDWEVAIAKNGKECLERYQTGVFDVILMDIQMPEMDGYKAARAIREKENGEKPVPIIALTAHALDEAREKSIKSGMNGYLTKPVDRAQLIALVRSLLPPAEGREAIVESSSSE